uniref:Uncharacterized protein n=1 Tax=Anguilla anguilla TaxID=7936 RepID=A0A0E9PDF3_ANGAN
MLLRFWVLGYFVYEFTVKEGEAYCCTSL